MQRGGDCCGVKCGSLAWQGWQVMVVLSYLWAVRGGVGGADSCGGGPNQDGPIFDAGSYMFAVALSLWLSCFDLVPSKLCIHPRARPLFQTFAVVMATCTLLNTLWTEMVTFTKVMDVVFCEFLVDIDMGAIAKKLSGAEIEVDISDIVGFISLIWVLHGLGVFSAIVETIKWAINEVQCAAYPYERAPRRSTPPSSRRYRN